MTVVSPEEQESDFKAKAMAAKVKIAKYTMSDETDSFSKTSHAVVVPLAMRCRMVFAH